MNRPGPEQARLARSPEIELVLIALAETPARLASLTRDLRPAQLRTSPGKGEWSANEVLAHLRACADVWGGSLAKIVAEDRPTLRAVNPRTWITKTNYLELEFHPSFRAFTKQRAQLLAVLESLPAGAWSRVATVTGAGRPLERTALHYAQWLARHERPHVRQVERIVKSRR